MHTQCLLYHNCTPLPKSNLFVCSPCVTDPDTEGLEVQHMRQMQMFLKAASRALTTVTSLDLEVPAACETSACSCDLGEHSTAILWPLPSTCPRLQILKLSGEVEAELLAEFGECMALTSLVTTNLPETTLEELSQLLPRVTSTSMTLFGDDAEYGFGEQAERYRLAVSACHTLVSLDVGECFLCAEDWLAMPKSLQKLSFCTLGILEEHSETGPPAGVELPNLIQVTHSPDTDVSLGMLANLLRAAPSLQSLDADRIILSCNLDDIPDLEFVHTRLAAGFTFKRGSSKHWEGVQVYLVNDGYVCPAVASLFASRLPVFEHFWSLAVGITEQPFLANMARAFPGLRMLRVAAPINSSAFLCLGKFPSLLVLELTGFNQSTLLELGALCWQISSLRFLDVGISPADEQALKAVLRLWGSKIHLNSSREIV